VHHEPLRLDADFLELLLARRGQRVSRSSELRVLSAAGTRPGAADAVAQARILRFVRKHPESLRAP